MYMHFLHSLFCQLPNCNLFTQHVIYLYGETPLVNCGPRSILLHSYYRLLSTSIIWRISQHSKSKKFLRMWTRKPRSNLGDVINERNRWDLHTLEKITQRKCSIERGWCSRTSRLLLPIRSDPSDTMGGASERCTHTTQRRILPPWSSKYRGDIDWISSTTAWCLWWRISAAGLRLRAVARERSGGQQLGRRLGLEGARPSPPLPFK
jgi:hypothetical protein